VLRFFAKQVPMTVDVIANFVLRGPARDAAHTEIR